MRRAVRAALLTLVVFAPLASAQRGRTELRGDIGWTGFLDDGTDDHSLVGASLQAYLTRRLSVLPEFQSLTRNQRNSGHRDYVLIGSVAYDLRSPGARIVPYVVVGGGLIHTRDRFLNSRGFSTTELFATGGAGVKLFVSERWYLAPDFRIGVEPHARFSVGVGYVLRR